LNNNPLIVSLLLLAVFFSFLVLLTIPYQISTHLHNRKIREAEKRARKIYNLERLDREGGGYEVEERLGSDGGNGAMNEVIV
jgi:hypothetical protein